MKTHAIEDDGDIDYKQAYLSLRVKYDELKKRYDKLEQTLSERRLNVTNSTATSLDALEDAFKDQHRIQDDLIEFPAQQNAQGERTELV